MGNCEKLVRTIVALLDKKDESLYVTENNTAGEKEEFNQYFFSEVSNNINLHLSHESVKNMILRLPMRFW